MSPVQFGFLLSLLAGLATGIGSLISIFVKKNDFKALAFGLGVSAGVMIYISLVELLPESERLLSGVSAPVTVKMLSFLMFLVGILIAGIIDYYIPDHIEPGWIKSKIKGKEEKVTAGKKRTGIYRVGFLTAIVIAVHNFPEGLATFVSGVADKTMGVSIALAIAIHNIPEGIAVSIPIYQATGSKRKAFLYSLLSGLTEPLGALFGFAFLRYFLNDFVFAFTYAIIAGIMVYIAFDELLPASREYGKDGHITIFGIVVGMFIIGMSLAVV